MSDENGAEDREPPEPIADIEEVTGPATGQEPKAPTAEAEPSEETAQHGEEDPPSVLQYLSNFHYSKRWEIAAYRYDDPDPFAKDIWFGFRSSGSEEDARDEAAAKAESDAIPAPASGGAAPAGEDETAPDAGHADGAPVGEGKAAPAAGHGDAIGLDATEMAFKDEVGQTLRTLKAIYRPNKLAELAASRGNFFTRLWRWFQRLGTDTAASANLAEAEAEIVLAERIRRFDEAYDRLFSLTALGLGTDGVKNLSVARDALRALRADTLQLEAGAIKDNYLRRLGSPALFAIILFVGLFLLYEKSPGFYQAVCGAGQAHQNFVCQATYGDEFRALFPNELYKHRDIFLLLAGCMLGTWLSFAVRKIQLTFVDLGQLELDQLEPRMRLVVTGTVTFVFALFFMTGLVRVEIGGFDTAEMLSDGRTALLLGALFGLVEQRLPTALMSRVNGLMDTVVTK